MSTRAFVLLLLSLLSACSAPQSGPFGVAWPWLPTERRDAPVPAPRPGSGGNEYARFNFDWLLDGDREIMPVQVFDDGARMWLQFPPEGTWPAVFEVAPGGWSPLRYRREGPYMVLDALHETLILRGGHLQGSISRPSGTTAMEVAVVAVPEPAAAEARPEVAFAPTPPVAPLVVANAASTVVPGVAAAHIPGVTSTGVPEPSVAALSSPSAQAAGGLFSVSPADITMRQALERWARNAGWAFSAEHWAVDVDIPLVGQASFQADFKSAVRDLLAATEMGDRPLQPCFYSNQVLRVVALSQPCDRRKGMGVMS